MEHQQALLATEQTARFTPSEVDPVSIRAAALGTARPYAAARCTCKEGYSAWHLWAAGMLDPASSGHFLEKASHEPPDVLAIDLWEHTWDGSAFDLFRMTFFANHPGKLPEERQREVLLGRTPAEIAFLAGQEIPASTNDGRRISALIGVKRWQKSMQRSFGR